MDATIDDLTPGRMCVQGWSTLTQQSLQQAVWSDEEEKGEDCLFTPATVYDAMKKWVFVDVILHSLFT